MKTLTIILLAFATSLSLSASDETILSQAKEAVAAGAFDKAAEALAPLVESGDNAMALYILGKAEIGLGRYDDAIKTLGASIEVDGGFADAYSQRALARTYKGMGMNMFAAGPVFMRSMDDYKKAIAIDPDCLSAHIGLSRYYSNAPAIGGGSMKKALAHAEEVLRLNPFLGYKEKGLVLQLQKQHAEAVGLFRKAVELNDHDAELHFQLGRSLRELEDVEGAVSEFKRALELNPDYREAKEALENS
ncbi:tetratricopeptide repeat protein [Pelagicoccus sp. SDUM812003]|uniref:tetratricopeptide repeat protein n=1 Tax=Pelagicoccus sp. SDUM812003 TaxID=3041267 RepID=UPI00280D782F|nr:tetratricopeptide repeat protein [Pelagicoccus sp. SDUM812003]MDQ8201961.1 tetratricopeptide repeat protein [Pelagicoccus sp. SDUM812003]